MCLFWLRSSLPPSATEVLIRQRQCHSYRVSRHCSKPRHLPCKAPGDAPQVECLPRLCSAQASSPCLRRHMPPSPAPAASYHKDLRSLLLHASLQAVAVAKAPNCDKLFCREAQPTPPPEITLLEQWRTNIDDEPSKSKKIHIPDQPSWTAACLKSAAPSLVDSYTPHVGDCPPVLPAMPSSPVSPAHASCTLFLNSSLSPRASHPPNQTTPPCSLVAQPLGYQPKGSRGRARQP
ncbi:hypothetical protein NPIL_643401 [Nephila pilipes]|uniref:Uncharacterized protein n=1 Tax=Nephila pilipes TaxID=299642 RepID=A0A8X6I4S1_NEPPI|nr:hypothetical protein NPIL_643401 [Nephila pilipes]